MNVLFVSHCLPTTDYAISNVGGMQRVASELADALSRRRDIEYESVAQRGTATSIRRRTPYFLLRTFGELRKRAKKSDVDVVLFSSMVTAGLAFFLRRTFSDHGVRSAAIVHGLDVTMNNRMYQRFVPRVFESLDHVLPVSYATANECVVRGLPRSKVTVVPNGIDTNRFPYQNGGRNGERSQLARLSQRTDGAHLPEDAFIICSVGRQVKRKGFSWFVANVMPLLPDDVHYVLAGDGPESGAVREKARAGNVAHRVHALGRVADSELQVLYRSADIFAMPNIPVEGDMEGFGVVMLEAGLSGLPIVASRLEGIQDVVEEGQNGQLVSAADEVAFARAILHYYNRSPHLHEDATRASRYTRRMYSWQEVSERYVAALRRIAGNEEQPPQEPPTSRCL